MSVYDSTGASLMDPVAELLALSLNCQEIEHLLGKLNFFTAIGAARAELRHSDFLRFLLSPFESHNLRDTFLRNWLVRCVRNAPVNIPISAEEIATLDLTSTLVTREMYRIDVLLVNEAHRFAVIIENKVDAWERPSQLSDYWEAVQRAHPDLKGRIIGLLLSPDGRAPSDSRYLAVKYETVRQTVDDIRNSRGGEIVDTDLGIQLKHYSELLASEFMKDDRVLDAAWDIHRKCFRAVDFIGKNSPSAQISAEVRRLIGENPDLTVGDPTVGWVNFISIRWKGAENLKDGKGNFTGWLFWLEVEQARVAIWLSANPDVSMRHARDALLKVAESAPELFRANLFPPAGLGKNVGGWPSVWHKRLLIGTSLQNSTRNEAIGRIEETWRQFLNDDLPKLRDVCAKALI